jgi:glutathione S-transferase
VDVSFYVFPGSHPCEAVLAAARYKGIPHRVIHVPPVWHRIQMKLMFGGLTVPAMKIGADKTQGTRAIMRALEAAEPEPPLYPSDATLCAAVIEAEGWGAGPFQDIGRRFIWSHLVRATPVMRSWVDNSWNPPLVPLSVLRALCGPVSRIAAAANKASDENVQADLVALPGLLDKIEGMIDDGVIGGEEPNAADFQIFSSVAAWMLLDDLRPAIASRPAGRIAARLFPQTEPGIPAGILPAEWFAPLRASGSPV